MNKMDSNDFPVPEVKLKVEDIKIKTEVDSEQGLEEVHLPYKEVNIKEEPYEFVEEKVNSNFIKKEPKDEELENESSNVVEEEQEDEETSTTCENSENSQSDTEKQFGCDECGRQFTKNQYLAIHKRTHTKERSFECDSCQQTFSTYFNLNRHKQYTHSSVTTFFICEECGRTFSRKDHLKVHVLTHKNQKGDAANDSAPKMVKTFACETCGRTYCNFHSLKMHMERHFNEVKSLENGGDETKREDVSIRIKSSNEVENRDDSSMRSFACDQCGKLFMKKWHLKNHHRTHSGERPFQCDRCDKRFTKRYDMKRHVRNVHWVDPQIVECPECDREFARPDYLRTHMKTHILAAVKIKQPKDKVNKDETQNRWNNLRTYTKKPSTVKTYGKCEVVIKQEKVEPDWMGGSLDGSNDYTCSGVFSSLDMLKQEKPCEDEDAGS